MMIIQTVFFLHTQVAARFQKTHPANFTPERIKTGSKQSHTPKILHKVFHLLKQYCSFKSFTRCTPKTILQNSCVKP